MLSLTSRSQSQRLILAKFSYPVCQLQTVEDPEFLLLHLLWTHLSQQLGREVHQVLHEEPHGPPGGRRDAGQSPRSEAKVDVLGSGEARPSFLDPGQRPRGEGTFM